MLRKFFVFSLVTLLVSSCSNPSNPTTSPSPNPTSSTAAPTDAGPTSVKEGYRITVDGKTNELEASPVFKNFAYRLVSSILITGTIGVPVAGGYSVIINLSGTGQYKGLPLPKGFKSEDSLFTVTVNTSNGQYVTDNFTSKDIKLTLLNTNDRLEGYFYGNVPVQDKTTNKPDLPVKIEFNVPFPVDK